MSVSANKETTTTFSHVSNPTEGTVQLATRKSLRVEILRSEEHPQTLQLAIQWAKTAHEKMQQTSTSDEPEVLARLKDNRDISLGFGGILTLKIIGEHIVKSVSPNAENNISNAFPIYACKDEEGTVHGLVCASESEQGAEGLLMVTAPRNIRGKVNESETGRVQGVGRTFLQFGAEELCKRGKKMLSLSPAESAKPFYRKFGFDFTEGRREITKNFAESEIPSKL